MLSICHTPSAVSSNQYRHRQSRLKWVWLFLKQDAAASPHVGQGHHLALGLITSPILADQVMHPLDERIGRACRQAKLIYTRYVDDLTISGPYDLEKSGFADLVQRMLGEHGFAVNPSKHHFGRLEAGTPITKIRVNRGHPDVRREYLAELDRQLTDAARLATGGPFNGPYYTQGQVWGRIQFIGWVNPGRRRALVRRFRVICWDKVCEEAKRRGLVAAKRSLAKRTPETPIQDDKALVEAVQ